MTIYMRDINDTPLLTAAEERELAYGVQDGDHEARDRLVRANLRLVVNIARRYLGRTLCLEDLIAEGNLGLLRAVEAFDPSLNTRFSTYASFWIHQSMRRALMTIGKAVRLPAYVVQLLTEWRRATARLQDELGRPPATEEVAQYLQLSRKKLAIIKKALRITGAVPQADLQDEGHALEDLLADERAEAPLAALLGADDEHLLRKSLERLGPREAAVLCLRFGLNGEEPLTLKEIGDHFGLTRERVRQIECAALKKLRAAMEAD
jgi:RNA polymerase primary sigma factor